MLDYPARRRWTMAINTMGLVLVGLGLAERSPFDAPAPIEVGAWSAWAAWAVAIYLPEVHLRLRVALSLVMIAGASLAAGTTDVVAYVPAASGLIMLAGSPEVPRRVAIVAGVESVVFVAIGALLDQPNRSVFFAVVGLLLASVLGGASRRQYRISESRVRALLEERVTVEQERAQVAALTERSRIARDLHDVLAHSLGGLALQLAAVDALLESGQTDQARTRVRDARELAVSGLAEATAAVSALREPDEPLSEVVAGLVAAHRGTGGQIVVRGDADRGRLRADGRATARRAVQELLTNARRHADGAPTRLDLDWGDGMLTITASTPAGKPGGGGLAGSGHGLNGMRERVREAGGTMIVREGPPFVVTIELPGETA
jgi:signal transduction histidine kinase